MTQPIIRWAGAKKWLLPRLRPIVQRELAARHDSRLVEPFAGSAALTLSVEPLNGLLADANGSLIVVYDSLALGEGRGLYNALSDLSGAYPQTKEGYLLARRTFNENKKTWVKNGQKFLLAAHALYLNRTCFNGLWRENLSGSFNVPFGKRAFTLPDLADLQAAARALKHVQLACQDWRASINRSGGGDFIYADPPYLGTFSSYTESAWPLSEHVALSQALRKAIDRGAQVALSQSIDKQVDTAYLACDWRERIEFTKPYAIGGKGSRRAVSGEVLLLGGKSWAR